MIVIWLLTVIHQFIQVISIQILEFHRRPLQLQAFSSSNTRKKVSSSLRRLLSLTWLFVCFFVPLGNFSLIWRRHHCRWRAANFDACSALMALEQWEFFSVPHLLWQGASVYGHLQGPMTITPNVERLTVELSLPVLTT